MMKKIEQTAVGHFKYLPEKLGFTTSQYQGLHIINCGLGSSMFNIVFGSLQSEPETWPNEIQNVIHQFREQPFTWWILPSQYLPDFSCCLKEEGFIQETREHAMLCNLEFFEPQLLQTKLVVRQVLNLNDLLDFISVLEPYDKMARCFYEKLSVDILNSKEKLFIGYQQSTPAVIGILFEDNESSGIFSLITEENERGKGFGTDMMRYLLRFAKKRGEKYVTLLASSDSGFRIYERLGFKSYGEFECFEWKINFSN